MTCHSILKGRKKVTRGKVLVAFGIVSCFIRKVIVVKLAAAIIALKCATAIRTSKTKLVCFHARWTSWTRKPIVVRRFKT